LKQYEWVYRQMTLNSEWHFFWKKVIQRLVELILMIEQYHLLSKNFFLIDENWFCSNLSEQTIPFRSVIIFIRFCHTVLVHLWEVKNNNNNKKERKRKEEKCDNLLNLFSFDLVQPVIINSVQTREIIWISRWYWKLLFDIWSINIWKIISNDSIMKKLNSVWKAVCDF